MEVSKFLDDTGKHARGELNTPVDIEQVEAFPAPDEIYAEKRTWKKRDAARGGHRLQAPQEQLVSDPRRRVLHGDPRGQDHPE
jgi:hypothetical protein